MGRAEDHGPAKSHHAAVGAAATAAPTAVRSLFVLRQGRWTRECLDSHYIAGDEYEDDGEGLGLGDGEVVSHATQNTLCLALPFSPAKFQKSL